jgi:hypothetical protein
VSHPFQTTTRPMTCLTSIGPPFQAFSGAGTEAGARHGINSGLEAIRRELLACGSELQSIAPFECRAFFDEHLHSAISAVGLRL